MNGELRWERRFGQSVPVVHYAFDVNDCEGIASVLGDDGWADDLRDDAAELRRILKPIPAPGGAEQ